MGSVAGPALGAVGSIAGGLLGSRSSGGARVPRWFNESAQNLARFGQGLAQRPFMAPPEDRVAGFSPDTLAAFDLVRQNVGAQLPAYQNAMQTAERLQNYNAPTINPALINSAEFQKQIGGFLSPYTNQVVNASLADLENSRAEQANALASAAQAANAFGGSRFGVAQGQFEADALRDKGLLAAQLRNQGFESAAGRTMQGLFANQDSTNRAALANQAASLASADVQNRNAFLQNVLAQNMGAQQSQDAESLARIGSAQQALEQQGLDNAYQDWYTQNIAYPQQQVGLWASALGPGATIGQQAPSTGGGLLGALGGAQLGANAANSILNWWQGLGSDGLTPINITARPI